MKVKLEKVPFVYPIPIVLVGANVDGKANYATVGDCAIKGLPCQYHLSEGENSEKERV